MIQKVSLHTYFIKNIYFNGNSNVGISQLSEHKTDVKDNFTYKTSTNNIKLSDAIKGSLEISGINYGEEYKLKRASSYSNIELTGVIGNKPVNVILKYDNILKTSGKITGFVGDKKIEIEDKAKFEGRSLKGQFGAECIDIWQRHFRNDELITGRGVNMQLMYYSNSNPKYVGEYNLDKDFLPILAGLYRFM